MTVEIRAEFEQFMRDKITSGAFASEQEVVEAALRNLRGDDMLAEIPHNNLEALIDQGLRDFESGDSIRWSRQEMGRLIREVLDEARPLVAAEVK